MLDVIADNKSSYINISAQRLTQPMDKTPSGQYIYIVWASSTWFAADADVDRRWFNFRIFAFVRWLRRSPDQIAIYLVSTNSAESISFDPELNALIV